jgi:hypothetical protein
MATEPLPVTGAWLPGDPPGNRKFFTFATDHPFAVESGVVLRDVTVAYETWGTLNSDASNAVLVCHAWTGDSHAGGRSGAGHAAPGWWDDMIGPSAHIDTNQYFVVCPNVLGGCQGTTGPASDDPSTGVPYGSRFPIITIRDQGEGMDLSKIPNPLAPENLLKTSGRGIFLMRSFMDVVEIRPSSTGTELKLIKHVHGPTAGGKEASQ